jgi:predicted transglutaminase-like cysteine proteinase
VICRYYCCKPLPEGRPCKNNEGVCRLRQLCPGGFSGGNWWLGECGAGAEFCCKEAPREPAMVPNSPLLPVARDDKRTDGAAPAEEEDDPYLMGPPPAPTYLSPEDWMNMDFSRHVSRPASPLAPVIEAENRHEAGAGTTVDTVDPAAKMMPDTFWPRQEASNFFTEWRTDFSHWADYLNRLQAEATRTHYWSTTNNQVAREWITALGSIDRSRPLADKIALAHDTAKRLITYREDALTFNTPDFWATPMQVFDFFESQGRAYGDCEDFSTNRYVSLRKLGVPTLAMRIAVFTSPQGPHAALIVNNDGVPTSLDNQRPRAVAVNENSYPHEHYQLVYSVNEAGAWLHVHVPAQRVESENSEILLSESSLQEAQAAQASGAFLTVAQRMQLGSLAPHVPEDEHEAKASAGTVTHGPYAKLARLAAERALGAYALGSSETSLARARVYGVSENIRVGLRELWAKAAFKSAVAYLADRVLRFSPAQADGSAKMPSVGNSQSDQSFHSTMWGISTFKEGSFSLFKNIGANGLLRATYLIYLESVCDYNKRGSQGGVVNNEANSGDIADGIYREAGKSVIDAGVGRGFA